MLDYDDRHRRRIAMTGDERDGVSCSICRRRPSCAAAMRLCWRTGGLVEVVAAPEPLLEIRCADRAASRPRRLASRQPASAGAAAAQRAAHPARSRDRGYGARSSAPTLSRSRRRSIRKAAPIDALRSRIITAATATMSTDAARWRPLVARESADRARRFASRVNEHGRATALAARRSTA